MERCPACGSSRIYPSRLRSIGERLRHRFTGRQPFRCHQCDQRPWARATTGVTQQAKTLPDELRGVGHSGTIRVADLDQLDPQ
jgi:hypothetical protein